jgi:MFS family permease
MAPSEVRSPEGTLRFPRAVWLLGWVSLLTDTASEAIYPLLPFFLAHIVGGSAVALGIIEGIAEGTNSVLRIVSGRVSDRWRTHRPLMIAGYVLSSVVRPFIGVAGTWVHVLAVRFADRVGKGIRSAPRDALLAFWATPGDRGRVYGFNRAMDHAGAVIGPLLATLFLLVAPGQYRALFLLTIVPGLIAVALVLRVREPDVGSLAVSADRDRDDDAYVGQGFSPASSAQSSGAKQRIGHDKPLDRQHLRAWRNLPRAFYAYVLIVLLFTLGNSSDAFLLLRLTEAAGGPEYIPLLWSALHVVKAGLSTAGGALSDRMGRRPVIVIAWLIYALVYGGFAVSSSFVALAIWLIVYGLFYALAEGTEKAYVADLAPSELRGTAFGIFQGVVGFGSLGASVLFGVVWKFYGAPIAFLLGASLALVSAALLMIDPSKYVGAGFSRPAVGRS